MAGKWPPNSLKSSSTPAIMPRPYPNTAIGSRGYCSRYPPPHPCRDWFRLYTEPAAPSRAPNYHLATFLVCHRSSGHGSAGKSTQRIRKAGSVASVPDFVGLQAARGAPGPAATSVRLPPGASCRVRQFGAPWQAPRDARRRRGGERVLGPGAYSVPRAAGEDGGGAAEGGGAVMAQARAHT